jgi:hypothetical protein
MPQQTRQPCRIAAQRNFLIRLRPLLGAHRDRRLGVSRQRKSIHRPVLMARLLGRRRQPPSQRNPQDIAVHPRQPHMHGARYTTRRNLYRLQRQRPFLNQTIATRRRLFFLSRLPGIKPHHHSRHGILPLILTRDRRARQRHPQHIVRPRTLRTPIVIVVITIDGNHVRSISAQPIHQPRHKPPSFTRILNCARRHVSRLLALRQRQHQHFVFGITRSEFQPHQRRIKNAADILISARPETTGIRQRIRQNPLQQ